VTTRPLLEVEGLSVSYGTATALFGASLSVEQGKVLAVLGPNGAGKSTLAHALSGLVPPSKGRIYFDGNDITGQRTHRFRRLGVTYIPEGRGIFRTLSVQENIRIAVRVLPSRRERLAAYQRTLDLFPILSERRRQRAGTLSGGEQQMLALSRALAVEPRLLIADEMSLGLAPLMVDLVFNAVETVKQQGVAIVLIEQFVDRALALADDCVILQHGAICWSGQSINAREAVVDAYLGTQMDRPELGEVTSDRARRDGKARAGRSPTARWTVPEV
jgi:branched-chain amino acid transport system ATP-binding protein